MTMPYEDDHVGRSVFDFTAELWRHDGEAGWSSVTLPRAVADRVDDLVDQRGGFGSIPVVATRPPGLLAVVLIGLDCEDGMRPSESGGMREGRRP